MGSANTTIATCLPPRSRTTKTGASSDGDAILQTLQVGTGLGVGYGAPELLGKIGATRIERWLPFEPEPGEIEQVLLSKGVRPITVPEDRRQLLIEQAAAREALRTVMDRTREMWRAGTDSRWIMPPMEPVIASGGVLVHAPRPSQAVLMLLDS